MSQPLQRSYFSSSLAEFVAREGEAILGALVSAHPFDTDVLQRRAWEHQIEALQQIASSIPRSHVFLEFTIPRMGKRADVILLIRGIIFVLEYKVGETGYPAHALDQALDYATDLKNFHEGSHEKKIVPILVSTKAPKAFIQDEWFKDGVSQPQRANDEAAAAAPAGWPT